MNQQEIMDDYNKAVANYIFDFLKSQGYRPKKTMEYALGLKKRLEKKGLELVVVESSEDCKTPTGVSGDEITVRVAMSLRCHIKPIGDNCLKCKHYIFKMMMNGYHGICDNRQLGDGEYVRADGYCEDFEKGRNKIYESERR